MSHWIACRFRDDEVLARCDAGGALRADGGFVDIVYKPGGKVYRTRPERLTPVEGAAPTALEAPPREAAPASARGGGGPPRVPQGPRARPESVAIQLWTDGACTGNPGPAGLGVVYRHRGEVRELGEYLGQATNNIAELMAILRGVQMVEDPAAPVDVMTDSMYCVGLLTAGWKAKANQDLVAELRAALARLRDVRIVKVPGHAGVPDNERADELARAAILARP